MVIDISSKVPDDKSEYCKINLAETGYDFKKLNLSPEDVTKKYECYLSPEDVTKKYEGYLSPQDAAEKDKKLKAYETNSVKMRIARENGLSYDAVDFLKGEDEKSIKESADALKLLLGAKRGAPPLASNESSGAGKESTKDESLRKMLSELRGE